MRVVLGTNVFVSGAINTGVPQPVGDVLGLEGALAEVVQLAG